MNKPVMPNSFTSDNKTQNKGDYDDCNETKYEAYPDKDSKRSRSRSQNESNTEAIIVALEKLHSKLQQLQQDRNLAHQAVDDLTKESEQLRYHLLHGRAIQPQDTQTAGEKSPVTEFQNAEAECQAVESNLQNILKAIQTNEASNESGNCHISTRARRPPPVTITKLKPTKRSPVRYKASNVALTKVPTKTEYEMKTASTPSNDTRRRHRHYKLNLKHLPFITSRVPGPSFSLPVNIQLLISSLKVHNPWFCSLTQECAATKELILKVEKDLKDVIDALRDSIGCLTMECCELCRHSPSAPDVNRQQQRITQLRSHRNALISHMQEVSDLEKQLHKLKKHFMTSVVKQTAENEMRAKLTTSTTDVLPPKRKKIVSNIKTTTTHNKQKNKTAGNRRLHFNRKPWNDQVVITNNVTERKQSVNTLRYMELLQTALKRNGLRLKPCHP